MTNGNSNDEDIWKQIQQTFNQIKEDTGIEPEEDYIKELEDMLGMSVDEMNETHMTMMKTRTLGVELIHEDAKIPSYAYPSDSGFDLRSTIEINIPPFGRALIPTGIKLSIPEEYEIQIRPKSGLALNQGLTVLNTPGTVDSGYVGEIKVIVFNTNNETVTVSKGMKIAQAVLCPVVCGKYVSLELTNKVEDKDRGDKGFGSTGL
jgi:dUTP pyrophosphatase